MVNSQENTDKEASAMSIDAEFPRDSAATLNPSQDEDIPIDGSSKEVELASKNKQHTVIHFAPDDPALAHNWSKVRNLSRYFASQKLTQCSGEKSVYINVDGCNDAEQYLLFLYALGMHQ